MKSLFSVSFFFGAVKENEYCLYRNQRQVEINYEIFVSSRNLYVKKGSSFHQKE
jgi:hypothetical protein